MAGEQRIFSRYNIPMQVELHIEGEASQVLTTRDVSDGGVFLEPGKGPLPHVGTKVSLCVVEQLDGDQAKPVKATVVRATSEGIGLKFDP